MNVKMRTLRKNPNAIVLEIAPATHWNGKPIDTMLDPAELRAALTAAATALERARVESGIRDLFSAPAAEEAADA